MTATGDRGFGRARSRSASVLGRDGGDDGRRGRLGWFRATDGSRGAPVDLDLDRPHATLVVGKRGSGKSNTLGVLAEELATARGVAPVVVDPMGEFGSLDDGVPATVVDHPRIAAAALDARDWCRLLDLDRTSAAGGLVWRAATACDDLAAMRAAVADSSAARPAARAAENHLAMAADWDVFDPDGISPADLRRGRATVLDLSGTDPAAGGAVLHAVASGLYTDALDDGSGPLPWLLVDEAAAFVGGVAEPALHAVLTRGRTPGVSLVLATQRPAALPASAVSQADLVVAHRLTATVDVEALEHARPTYLRNGVGERLPSDPGVALVVDETAEEAVTLRVRERTTPHGGTTPRATERSSGTDGNDPAGAAMRTCASTRTGTSTRTGETTGPQ